MEQADDDVHINVLAKDVEAVELDENFPGWAAVYIRLAGGSMLRLEFDAQALLSLEKALGEAQRQMSEDQGVQ